MNESITDKERISRDRNSLGAKIRKYETEREKGANMATSHEELRLEVLRCYGEPVAKYFDLKGSLPFVQNRVVPWPIERSSGSTVTIGRYAAGIAAFYAVVAYVPVIEPLLRLGLAAVVGVLVFLVVFPFFAGLFPPKDIARRKKDFAEFQVMLATHAEAQNAEAETARRQRLEGH